MIRVGGVPLINRADRLTPVPGVHLMREEGQISDGGGVGITTPDLTIQDLKVSLKDSNPMVRAAAAFAFATMGQKTSEIVNTAMEVFQGNYYDHDKYMAKLALIKLGEQAAPLLINSLRELVTDYPKHTSQSLSDEIYRDKCYRTISTLRAIGTEDAISELKKIILSNGSIYNLRWYVAEELVKMGKKGEHVVVDLAQEDPSLTEELTGNKFSIQAWIQARKETWTLSLRR